MAELRAAADRLIAGTPLRSPGKLTISDLAAEAGIKRWILTHRHPELMRSYQTEFKNLGRVPAPVQAALDKITKLELDLAKIRADKKHLKNLVDTYAALIQELIDELDQARSQRDAALLELDRSRDGVQVLTDHRRTRRDDGTITCS